MKARIMQTNELRGILYEFGIVLPEGHRALLKELPAALREAQERLPAMLIDRTRTLRRDRRASSSLCRWEPRRRMPSGPAGLFACTTGRI